VHTLKIGTEFVPETSENLHILTCLSARENFIFFTDILVDKVRKTTTNRSLDTTRVQLFTFAGLLAVPTAVALRSTVTAVCLQGN
jgi:hypothetical protein